MCSRHTGFRQMKKRWIGLAMLTAIALLSLLPPSRKEVQPLGQRDGVAVFSGAPPAKGTAVLLSRQTLLQGKLMQVSPAHPLPADFPAPNTRSIRAQVGSYLPACAETALWADAVYALCEIQLDYPLETGAELTLGALSSAQQDAWQKEAFRRYAAVYPLEEALALAKKAVPGGGESEHQLGYALDVALTGPLAVSQTDPLLRNETGRWLSRNLWRYGWIYRYGPGSCAQGACEHIHLRFVGKIHAAAMHALGLEMEDYLALLRREQALTLTRNGQPWAYLYGFPCENDLVFPLEDGMTLEASADNTGWALVAVYQKE